MRVIGAGVIDGYVYSIATSAAIIAVSAHGPKGVWMFDVTSGDLIRSFGELGPAEGQLTGNDGLRFTPDGGHILIAEERNHRLSLFTVTGDFVRCIGVGMLRYPVDVEFTPAGDILVADSHNHRVCALSPDGSTLLRSFGSEGDAPGKFRFPTALTIHGDKLFVLDWGSARVQVFK